jgi:hypothetical protein
MANIQQNSPEILGVKIQRSSTKARKSRLAPKG